MVEKPNKKRAVFGYGSLVNRLTHSYHVAHLAQLHGWRRVWRHARTRPVAFLSIEPHPTTLFGLLAQVPDQSWQTLDAREHAYVRRDVNHQIEHAAGPIDAVAYEANPDMTAPATTGHPILLSYLDVVVAGHYALLGTSGPQHFFETTTGWGPVLDDRTDPLYPRALPLSDQTRTTVDAALADLAVAVHPAEDARVLVDAIRSP